MKKVFIVAEIGINANGSVELAKKLIDAAKEAGCDAVKFQKRDIDTVYTKEELDKPRQSPWGSTNREQKRGLEFNEAQFDEINEYCKQVGIDWFVSCWDLKSFAFMKKYNCKYNKVASALLGHKDLMVEIAKEQKLTLISTGMSTVQDINDAVTIFENYNCPFVLLHCNSQYPQPDDQANLSCITWLKEYFMCEVGYSCHSTGILPPALAVMFGATVIEKHITLDRAMYGSDQAASVEPSGLKKMVEYIRLAEKSIGDGYKVIYPGEEPIAKKLKRTQG